MSCIEVGKRYTGKSEKPSDCWTLPLCGKHHRIQHANKEEAFWQSFGIDPFKVAAFLYASSGDFEAGESIIRSRGDGYTYTPIPGIG